MHMNGRTLLDETHAEGRSPDASTMSGLPNIAFDDIGDDEFLAGVRFDGDRLHIRGYGTWLYRDLHAVLESLETEYSTQGLPATEVARDNDSSLASSVVSPVSNSPPAGRY